MLIAITRAQAGDGAIVLNTVVRTLFGPRPLSVSSRLHRQLAAVLRKPHADPDRKSANR
jgi:hypothetical protein